MTNKQDTYRLLHFIAQCLHAPSVNTGSALASFPGLHAQLLSLAVQKVGEGLEGFIT